MVSQLGQTLLAPCLTPLLVPLGWLQSPPVVLPSPSLRILWKAASQALGNRCPLSGGNGRVFHQGMWVWVGRKVESSTWIPVGGHRGLQGQQESEQGLGASWEQGVTQGQSSLGTAQIPPGTVMEQPWRSLL